MSLGILDWKLYDYYGEPVEWLYVPDVGPYLFVFCVLILFPLLVIATYLSVSIYLLNTSKVQMRWWWLVNLSLFLFVAGLMLSLVHKHYLDLLDWQAWGEERMKAVIPAEAGIQSRSRVVEQEPA